MSQIIGIGGKLASGKDAISDYLVENHGWVKIGMSDALAEALYVLDPYVPIHLPDPATGKGLRNFLSRFLDRKKRTVEIADFQRYSDLFDEVGYVEAKTNEEVRRLLQKLGTEVGRKIISESVWTDIIVRRAKEAAKTAPGVIITGIRYPNELGMITDELDGELWWVVRPSLQAGSNSEHSSENSVRETDFDRTIRNDGTLDELYQKVSAIVS
ncbi:deoxynucleoside monophosphate kinase [Microbacterium phage PauloDiaboli]|nr:deoxynucleoside monophosphate kinase [Microbacterium phage PauloDiaboli]